MSLSLQERRQHRRWQTSKVIETPTHHSKFGTLAIICAVFFVIILICFLAYNYVFVSAKWQQNSEKNILIVPSNIDGFKGDILFAHISPNTNKIEVRKLNSAIQIPVIGGYGNYPLQSIFPLLFLDKKSPEFMRAAYIFGLKNAIDEVWTSRNPQVFDSQTTVTKIAELLLQYQIQSQWTLRDRINLYNFVRTLRSNQINSLNVTDFEQWQKSQDTLAFTHPTQDCEISVINMTNITGIGNRVTNVIEKSGYTVLRLTDEIPVRDHSLIIASPEAVTKQCSETLLHLQYLFPDNIPIQQDAQTMNKFRSQIVLLIGNDTAQKIQALQ